MANSDLDEIADAQIVRPRAAPAATIGVAVTGDGQRRVAIGAAGRVGPEAAGPSTIFDLASVTKPFVAVTAARLAERGRLSLQTRLAELIPESQGTPSAELPLELLLSHRAGLAAHLSLFAPLVSGSPFDRKRALATAVSARRKDCLGPAPEAGFPPVYSDLGYLLLGVALERAEGLPLDELVLREICAPLGLEVHSSRVFRERDAAFAQRVAPTETVRFRGGQVRGQVHDENAWALTGHALAGHAGLFGTAEALLRFGCSLLDAFEGRGDWLHAESLRRLLRERPGSTLRAGFDGKSTENSAAGSRAGPRTFGHLGFTGTSLWCDPDHGLVSVLLSNRVCPTRENTLIRAVRPRVHDALFGFFGP